MDASGWKSGNCFFCHSLSVDYCCLQCTQDFFKTVARCPVCASRTTGSFICGDCLKNPNNIDNALVIADYDYPVDRLIKSIKYQAHPELIHQCASSLSEQIRKNGVSLPDCLIPVPLHRQRQQERGFNQSQLLAKELSKRLDIATNDNIVIRSKYTKSQSGLTLTERKKNVNKAFHITGSLNTNHVAIIDDVITTGSTVNEIAKLLKASGCQEIDVWAIARTRRN